MENPDRVTYFAATDARGSRVPFGIKQKDRAKHLYVIGKTGMGKSTMLENMAIQDIQNGEGLAFIDPHGATADKLLDYIPQERVNDVVYFAPFDLERPIAFNVMEDVGYDKRHLVVSGLMATFKKIWVDAWSARMEYILTNTLLALLEYPDATLLGVNRMYTDKEYRKKVVENIKDPVVKDFWVKEFSTYTDRYTQEATPAIQNKIGQFTGNPLIRNIIGQPKSAFDIRTLMDEKKILIINLSKGRVGDTNTQLLGSMLTTRIFLAAMSRADLPAKDLQRLPNFYFYVDEFQNFANETFAEILSESRKYKLNLVIAHQYIEQMEEEVRDAVFGNVGTTVVFRVGPFDAEVLETVFMPEFTQEDLVNLGFAQIYLTLMIDGVGSRPFSAVTIPPIEPPAKSFRSDVVESSRAQFGHDRADIEKSIMDELTPATPPASATPRTLAPKRPSAPRAPAAHPLPAQTAPRFEERPRPPQKRREDAPPRERREEIQPRERAGRERREEIPPPRPQTPERPPPAAALRSAEDLKSILRNISRANAAEREKKTERVQGSLKDTLAVVLKKSESPDARINLPAPPPVPSETARGATPARELPPATDPAPASAKPFEIPEDRLRDILNGNE